MANIEAKIKKKIKLRQLDPSSIRAGSTRTRQNFGLVGVTNARTENNFLGDADAVVVGRNSFYWLQFSAKLS